VSRQIARRVLIVSAWAVLLVLVVTLDAAAGTFAGSPSGSDPGPRTAAAASVDSAS
jgi:hypothetical protein